MRECLICGLLLLVTGSLLLRDSWMLFDGSGLSLLGGRAEEIVKVDHWKKSDLLWLGADGDVEQSAYLVTADQKL